MALRARVSANEASAIGDIRTVISAQAAYSSASQGGYGELRCLSEPKTCLTGYRGPSGGSCPNSCSPLQ